MAVKSKARHEFQQLSGPTTGDTLGNTASNERHTFLEQQKHTLASSAGAMSTP